LHSNLNKKTHLSLNYQQKYFNLKKLFNKWNLLINWRSLKSKINPKRNFKKCKGQKKSKRENFNNKWFIKWWTCKLKWKKNLLNMKTLWGKFKTKWWMKSICLNLPMPYKNWSPNIFHKCNSLKNLIKRRSQQWNKNKKKASKILLKSKEKKFKILYFNMKKTWQNWLKSCKLISKCSMIS